MTARGRERITSITQRQIGGAKTSGVPSSIAFSTSLGFGRKLDRIRRDPKVALAFHSRQFAVPEPGSPPDDAYVLVQGRAEIVAEPDDEQRATLARHAEREPHLP